MRISKRKMKANIIKILKEFLFEREEAMDELKNLLEDFLDWGECRHYCVDINKFGRDERGIMVLVRAEGENYYFYSFNGGS